MTIDNLLNIVKNFTMIPLDKLQEDTKINETVQGNFI